MDCWTVLQLADDADERTIKRTYARLLKSCRPDDDAEGFQRLREAYENALNIARWRAEHEDEDEDVQVINAPVAELAEGNPHEYAEFADIRPVSPAPFDLPPEQTRAQALINGLGAHNLGERWEQAQHQRCADAFQAALLRHCFEAPGERAAIAAWAVQHLEWLTPWQGVAMSPWQHEALSGELLQAYRQTLQEQLEQKAEREFVNQLNAYNQRPWLRVFDLQQQWQRILLQLLHDTQWSVPLFERVCQAFGWDDQKGVHPEPTWMWRQLVSRCEQESFFDNLLDKAHDTRRTCADALAARLLVTAMSVKEQKRLVEGFDDPAWNATQHLAEVLNWRYPALLERLPDPNVFFWRKFLPRGVTLDSWIRVWAGLALASGLAFHPLLDTSLPAKFFLFILLTAVPAIFALRGAQIWADFASRLIVQDLWLSERLLPKRLSIDQFRLVLRHGIPQLVLLLVFGYILGIMGMLTHLGMILISLFHSRRIGKVNENFNARIPWIKGLHWAYWSPLQVVFLVAMVAVTLACQKYLPAIPWTSLNSLR
ncbi:MULTISPECIES: J domain-containing protein [unclassified Pseudomonas]|uniref:J domain-containing protein n=1 Tax=unclassified Pseudomonas TaxID=196821 RepID=UPI001F5AB4E0|nr:MULTISPECIES: J domain-containing protein [unclassified Pseudomonas]